MFDDIKAIKEMQRVQAGGVAKLSKSQIIAGAFNLRDLVQGLDKATSDKCIAFYDEVRKDKSKETYDSKKLFATINELKKRFDEIMHKPSQNVVFMEIFDEVETYLMSEPFKDMEDISYGFREVCVFAAAEYLAWIYLKYESNAGIEWYKASMVDRSDEKTAETMMWSIEAIQQDIADDMSSIYSLDRTPLEKTNLMIYICAFKAMKKLCLHKCDEKQFAKILDQGDFNFVLEFFDSDGSSDASPFMDNFINLENFLVSYFQNVVMKHVRNNRN